MLAIVVLGGLGSQLGVALAALVMIGGSEMLRGITRSRDVDLVEYRMLFFGIALVVVMVLRPRGPGVGPHALGLAGPPARDRGRAGGRRPWLRWPRDVADLLAVQESLTMRFGGLLAVDASFVHGAIGARSPR